MTENLQQPFVPLAPMPPAPKLNWFARHKIMTGFGAVVLVAAIGGAASGGSGSDTSTVDSAADTKTATSTGSNSSDESKTETESDAPAETKADEAKRAAEAKPAAETAEVVDGLQPDGKSWIYGDWKVSNVKVKNDGVFDWFKIVADVKYLGEDTSGGDKCFDLTLDKGDRQVASSTGCADGIQPGKTAAVDFMTTDEFTSGPYEISVSKTW